MGVSFAGKRILQPGAYSRVDASAMIPISLGAFKVLAMFGSSEGGVSKEVMYFNSPTIARRVLRKGTLLTMMEFSWSPSGDPDVGGADLICAIRVNDATPASVMLIDGDSADMIELTSKGHGSFANDIDVRIVTDQGTDYLEIRHEEDDIEEVFTVTGKTNDDIVSEINAESALVIADKKGDGTIVNPTDWTNLSGGTGSADDIPSQGDYQDALDLLLEEPVDILVPGTVDEGVHAIVKDHCLHASENRKERRMVVGHANTDDIAAVKARAFNLNTHRATFVTPSVKRFNRFGELVTYEGNYMAALIAGMIAGVPFEYPITFNNVSCMGLTKNYTDVEVDQLLEGGVLPVKFVRNRGYRVVHGITTHLADTNTLYKEISCSMLADVMSKNLREVLEMRYVGKPGTRAVQTSMYNTTLTTLTKFWKEQNWLVDGYDDAGNYWPAFRNVSIEKEGTVYRIDWEGSVVEPVNYILITSYFVPLK